MPIWRLEKQKPPCNFAWAWFLHLHKGGGTKKRQSCIKWAYNFGVLCVMCNFDETRVIWYLCRLSCVVFSQLLSWKYIPIGRLPWLGYTWGILVCVHRHLPILHLATYGKWWHSHKHISAHWGRGLWTSHHRMPLGCFWRWCSFLSFPLENPSSDSARPISTWRRSSRKRVSTRSCRRSMSSRMPRRRKSCSTGTLSESTRKSTLWFPRYLDCRQGNHDARMTLFSPSLNLLKYY